MQNYRAGDIVELMFPFQEVKGKKIRPALVVKDYGKTLAVLKITSQHKGRKWDIEIPKDDFNGLAKNSVIQADSYIELDKTELCQVIPRGAINPIQLGIVKQRLEEYLRTIE